MQCFDSLTARASTYGDVYLRVSWKLPAVFREISHGIGTSDPRDSFGGYESIDRPLILSYSSYYIRKLRN